ncbi:putative amine oxidase [Operophtera brumata]|uniref:Putative amine oxidase n=1 Tax=Operophtera brumata TaxID=104452 RepID=A0A0L7LIZ3_OPEBR|nr:putative amine oxidase [Operophtera brumata]
MMRWTAVLLCAIGVATGSPMAPLNYDTIVVGMGPSGTMAATTLAKAGKRVLALEAQDRIGGRVRTVPFGDGIVELGAEWSMYRSDGSEADSALVNDLLTFSLGVVDEPPPEPEPLGQYITRSFLKFMDLVIDTYESSNTWNDVSTTSSFVKLGGDQNMSWHTHGYKTLFEIILDSTGPVEVTVKDGTVYKADNVIVTVSLGVLKERHTALFTPPLPEDKAHAIDVMSIGVVNKVTLRFPFKWCPNNFCGFLWRTEEESAVPEEDRWLTKTDGATVPQACNTCITLWFIGDNAKLVSTYLF